MTSPKSLPDRARIVIVGGGVGGTSIAYHLAGLGERDVVLVERADLTSGSTFHSAGLVGQLRADPTLTQMNMHSVALYRELQRGENPPGWVECGGIRLAGTPERMEEIRRQIGWAAAFGLPLEEISAAEAKRMFPLMSTEGVLGGAYLATDGYVDPSQLTYALAAGARAGGVRTFTHTRVLGVDVRDGRVTGVRTDRGDVEAEIVVNCGGMFAAEIGRMAGVRVPVVPMSHQYLVTEPLRERDGTRLPTLRDPDNLVYFREEVDGLVMGGYERRSAPWALDDTDQDAVPADFNGRLLAEDWDRFEEIAANSRLRVPAMADAGILKVINGPEAFTPDNEFCLGETEVGGLFVAAGFCAHGIAGAGGIGQLMAEWIVTGEPPMTRLAHGRPPVRRALPVAVVHAQADGGELRDLLRHPVSRTASGRPGAPCGSPPRTACTRSWARSSARRRAGSGSSTTRRTPPATPLSGRAAGPDAAGPPRSAPSTPRPVRPRACSTSRRSPRSR